MKSMLGLFIKVFEPDHLPRFLAAPTEELVFLIFHLKKVISQRGEIDDTHI